MRLRRLKRRSWTVLAACSDRGDCPLTEFLQGLEGKLGKQARRAWSLLDVVASVGPPRNTDVSHRLAPDIWEFISGDLRILWFYDERKVVVCSHGFVKQRQKTPKAQLEQAELVRQRYFLAKRRSALQIEDEENGQW